jgi:hypothetical protein
VHGLHGRDILKLDWCDHSVHMLSCMRCDVVKGNSGQDRRAGEQLVLVTRITRTSLRA